MTLTDSPEEAAFIAAVNAQPTDDLPRLIYADWLEEAGFAERAEQIRLQIALAQAKPWDAISIQHLRLDLGSYRRGFPWRMTVYDIPTLIRTLRSNAVPIGAIDIGTCPLNHWEELVALPEFQRIEEIRFTGLTLPIEPLRALRDAPNACNVTTLIFNRSNSLAFPEMIRELYLFPLGPQLKRLEIHFGQSGNEEDLFEAMTEHGQPIALEEFRYDGPLALHRMNQRDGFLKVVRQVKRLELPGADLTGHGMEMILSNRKQHLEFLNLENAELTADDCVSSLIRDEAESLRWLDFRSGERYRWLSTPSAVQHRLVPKLAVLRENDDLIFRLRSEQRQFTWLEIRTDSLGWVLMQIDESRVDLDSLERMTIHMNTTHYLAEQAQLKKRFGDKLELLDRPVGGFDP